MDVRDAIRDREPISATWVSIGHPAVAELAAALDFDAVFLDSEHAPNTVETIENLVRAVETGAARGPTGRANGGAEAIVRVPWNDPVRIKRVLDAGPAGVMAPMLESREDAEAFVEATRYPPEGVRGIAASRASAYGLTFEEYVETVNERLLAIGQVETERGIENAADIAAVDGLDALFVGPADLSAAVGAFGETESEAFDDAVGTIVTAAHDADTAVGTLAVDPDEIEVWLDRGVDFVVAGWDLGYLASGAREARKTYGRALDQRE